MSIAASKATLPALLSASPVWNLLPDVRDEIIAGESEWLQPLDPGATAAESYIHRVEIESAPNVWGRTETLGTIAVIPVDGVIVKGTRYWRVADLQVIASDLKEARDDAAVTAIVLFFNTPGGTTIALREVAELIEEIDANSKPVLAYTETLCASAGYYLASACRAFYASPTSRVGSVGSRIGVYDLSENYKNMGIEAIDISSGDLKGMGFHGAPVTEAHLAAHQSEVDRAAGDFIAHVQRRRGEIPAEVLRGGVFWGEDAIAMNLVDGTARDLEQFIQLSFEVDAAL